MLVGQTEVGCFGEEQKRVNLTQGTLFASVTPQEPDRPLLLTTPAAGIEVIGTTFTVTASETSSKLRVTDGTMRLTRTSDDSTIDAPKGKQVDTSNDETLKLRNLPPPPDSWAIDFKDGVPAGWVGTFMNSNLPEDHDGAINTVLDPQNLEKDKHDDKWARHHVDRVIISPRGETNGLFAIGKNTHFHVTYHTKRSPGTPVMMSLVTLSAGDSSTLNRYQAEMQRTSGEFEVDDWIQVSIPIFRFRGLDDPKLSPSPGELPLWIEFNCGPGRIFQLTRIAANQEGPGRYLIRSEDELERRAAAKYRLRILVHKYWKNDEFTLTQKQVDQLMALAEETWPKYKATDRSNADLNDKAKQQELKQARAKINRQFYLRVDQILTEEQKAILARQAKERAEKRKK